MQARTVETRVVKELSPEVMDAFKDARLLALDVEGVDLSREGACLFTLDLFSCAIPDTCCAGQCSLVQLAVLVDDENSQCFLFDVLNKTKEDPMINFLREILESESVLKIIHDCRMDSDALHHLLDIKLANVHDTSAWHYKLTYMQDVNLNDMLQSNGLKPNVVRDGEIYRSNHAFWATRPLTERMITWAAGDVSLMFKVHALQVGKASPDVAKASISLSDEHLDMARSAELGRFKVKVNVGSFIGSRGSNLRALQRSTNTLIYSRGPRSSAQFMVFYKDEASLQRVKARAGDA
jgi:exonuclease 3'-5' domain-containing protein 1